MEEEKPKQKRQLPFHPTPHAPVVSIELSDEEEEQPTKRPKLQDPADMTETRCRCEAEEIPEKFLTLVGLCSPSSDHEVLTELLHYAGDVKATISHFRGKRLRSSD